MRFATHGTNSRALRLIEAVKQHHSLTPTDLQVVELLAFILSVTYDVTVNDDRAEDHPDTSDFIRFWRWYMSTAILNPTTGELNPDPAILSTVWDMFMDGVSVIIQNDWRRVYVESQTRYPADPLHAKTEMIPDNLAGDPDFLASDAKPGKTFGPGRRNRQVS
jgi:hypothetical protein